MRPPESGRCPSDCSQALAEVAIKCALPRAEIEALDDRAETAGGRRGACDRARRLDARRRDVHRGKRVAKIQRRGPGIDVDPRGEIDRHQVEQRVIENAVQFRHAVDQRLDFAARPAHAEPAQEHGPALGAAEGADLVVAGDGHARGAAQGRGKIERVHLLELIRADGGHRRGKRIGLRHACEGASDDLNGRHLHAGTSGAAAG